MYFHQKILVDYSTYDTRKPGNVLDSRYDTAKPENALDIENEFDLDVLGRVAHQGYGNNPGRRRRGRGRG